MKRIATVSALVLAMSAAPMTARANDFVGGLVGGIIGGAIANSAANQSRTRTVTVQRSSGVSSATREQNRDVQTALNYFGFNAGGADGVLGARSRAAISAFQGHMGYSPTGQLTSYERTFLVGSFHRAQAGGPTTAQLIASNPQGVRGLLTVYRDEQVNGGSATASIGGHYGLPTEVAAAVNEIAKSSDPSAEQLVQRSGFIQLADINGDGRTDYIIDTSVTGSAFWCNAQACAVRVFASTPEGYARNDFQAFNVTPAMFSCQRGTCAKTGDAPQMAAAPAVPQQSQPGTGQPQTQMVAQGTAPVPTAVPSVQGGAAAAAPALPQFFANTAPAVSLQSHCNMVNLVSATNGGLVTAATMSDGNAALGEQMCLARTYAIAAGEDIIARIPNMSADAVAGQCAGMGQVLGDHVAAASLQPREEVLRGVGGFVLSSGMAPQQLETTARICLAAGYKVDDMDTAIGSALVLVALGQAPYAELVGHHLSQGFGTTRRADLASGWYGHAIQALGAGSTPVFGAGQPERVELLRKAVAMSSGKAMAPASTGGATAAALPVFSISD